jgi:hypothetical protein
MDRYSEADSKMDKSLIVSEVVNGIRERSPDGGFIKKDKRTGRWFEVGDHLAREKVGQQFRDALHTQYRSSTKAKSKRKKARKQEQQLARASSSRFVKSSIPAPSRLEAKSMSLDTITREGIDILLDDMIQEDMVDPGELMQ